jgi:hypothetical protein
MSGNKQAKVDVIINNEQARARLAEITKDLNEVKKMRDKAFETGDVKGFNQLNTEYKKLTTEAGKFAKQSFDVNAVMKNLSGASIRELNMAYKQTNEELKNLKRNDPGYAAKKADVKALKDELNSANGTMSKQGLTLNGLMSTVGGWAAGLGIATGAMGAVKAVISATDTLSDKFNETIGGLSAGMSYLSRSIATLDFSNFLTNMGNAITAGREYVSTLDKIGDRTRAIGIIESNDRARLADLLIIRKDVTKTDKERIEAGKEILNIEQNNAERRKSLTKDQLDNELKYASKMTGLSKERIGQLLIEQETNRAAIEKANQYNSAMEVQRNANSRASGATMYGQDSSPVISKETLNTIKSASPAIKQLASELKSFGKLNEEEYDRITNTYKNVGEANAYYSETTAKTQVGLSKLRKGQLDDEERDTKTHVSIIKEAQKTISQLITEKDSEIEAAIQAGNIPLAEKTQVEKKALEQLLETYKQVKIAISQGWDMNQRDQGSIDKLVSIGAKAVKSDSPATGKLVKRDNKITAGPSKDIIAGEENKKKQDEQIKEAAFTTAIETNNAIFDIVKNRQQAEFDHAMSLIEIKRKAELDNVNLTELQKKAINDKYDKQASALKAKQFEKDQRAAVIQAIISGALAIAKTFASYGFTPAGWIAAAGQAAATLIQIAVIKSQKPPEFYEGGFTNQDTNDRKPAGIVHANEFIGSAAAVRNPSVKPYFDVIDYAQRNGTISQINLQAINVPGKKEYRSGGYATSTIVEPTQISKPSFGASNHLSDEALSITREISKQIAIEFKDGIKGIWVLNDLEKIMNDKKRIESSVDN